MEDCENKSRGIKLMSNEETKTGDKILKKEIDIKKIIEKEKEYYLKIRNFKKHYDKQSL